MAKSKKDKGVARTDQNIIRLSVAYNTLVDKDAVAQLPEDMREEAIPNQVLEHEKILNQKRTAKTTESSKREKTSDAFDGTARKLTRLRHGILSAYEDAEDPRLANYGALGVGATPAENLGRLNALAVAIVAPLASGEITLVADLQPEALRAQATKHDDLSKGKAGAVATRQVKTKSLEQTRRESRRMLQRIKNFAKAFFGAESLTEFGFDLPLPTARPRLKGVVTDTEPPVSEP
jgi:hypothetical protein